MTYKQQVSPNLDAVGRAGWCLAFIETVFDTPHIYVDAHAAWLATTVKHQDRSVPSDVSVPLWFDWVDTQGKYGAPGTNFGHAGVWVPGRGVLTSPLSGSGSKWLGSIADLERTYGVQYVGWSEDLAGVRIVEPVADPVPVPAPQPASASYEVVRSVPGYRTSNDAANHINKVVDVPAGSYSVFNRANGMVNVTTVPGQAGSWINPADNVVEPPQPPVPAKPANIAYTKLETPMNLVTNKQPTDVWDLGFHDDAHASSVATLDQGAPFEAYGRAQRTDGDKPAYFMDADSFGQADTTGIPAKNQGINTVDLSPAPAQPPAQPAIQQIKIVDNSGMPEEPAPAPAPTPSLADMPVGVEDYKINLNPVDYVLNEDYTVVDITGKGPDLKWAAGTKVTVGWRVKYLGYWYYRAQSSVDKGTWYLWPVSVLRKRGDNTPAAGDGDIDQLAEEITQEMHQEATSAHDAALKAGGTLEGSIIRILRALHLIK